MSDCNETLEKIVEYLEAPNPGFGTHHTLYFDPDEGVFVLESIGVEINEGDVEMTDLDSQEAYEWAVGVAGMGRAEAARAIIGADQDTPR